MKTFSLFFFLIIGAASSSWAEGSNDIGLGGCAGNIMGTIICAPPFGGIAANTMGTFMCGRGQCVKNIMGTVFCSSVQGGGAALNVLGTPMCTGGCELATQSLCERGKP